MDMRRAANKVDEAPILRPSPLASYRIAVQASYFAFHRKILTGHNDLPYYTINLTHAEIPDEITDFDHPGRILAEQFHGICPR
jgi:hypothetical protein